MVSKKWIAQCCISLTVLSFYVPNTFAQQSSMKTDNCLVEQTDLSTNKNPANGKLIASTNGTWTNYQQWGARESQKSEPISLKAGYEYSFVLLHKEGNGGDHFSAGWQLPSGTIERPMSLTNFSVSIK